MNNQRINLTDKVANLKYKNMSKSRTNSITVSFKISGIDLEYLHRMAQKEGVSINIFCKNLTLCYIEKEEREKNPNGC
ncbi:MAG: hypothetical protein LBD63_03035 [Mycoplasmataceae bacterium]|jgi:hypothetical protein|nr:hypothetical protein [Mycoplasmataceae bacterium]